MTPAIKAMHEARGAAEAYEDAPYESAAFDAADKCADFLRSAHTDTILALHESREAAARAVVWAYDQYMDAHHSPSYCLACATIVFRATGKHPRDWTRPALLAHLGLEE